MLSNNSRKQDLIKINLLLDFCDDNFMKYMSWAADRGVWPTPDTVDQALAPALLHAVRSPLSCWSANICCICAISVAFTINIHLPFILLPKLDAGWRGIYLRAAL